MGDISEILMWDHIGLIVSIQSQVPLSTSCLDTIDNYNEFEMKRMKGLLESALTQIHQLPNLKGLRLHFWPSWKDLSSATVEEHGASFLSRQMTLLDALRNSEPPPSLKSLSITNLCLLHRHPERRGGAQRSFFSQLSEITITVLSSAEHGLVAATHSGNRPIVYGPRDYLPQSHSHLTSLTLRSPRGIFHTHDLCPHGIYYPRLNTLSLENIVLGRPSSPGSMISFILSHKLTLQKLELFSCSVIVTGDPDEALGSWSQILNRFSKDLKVLREINIVAGSQENAKVGMAYTMFVENKELEAYLSSAQRVKADNLSLERIRYVVDTRRAMRRM